MLDRDRIMRFLERGSGGRRRLMLAALAALTCVPVQGQAQESRRRAACEDCDLRRLKALERLDSLRWLFEHERLSAAERENLRREMADAVDELRSALNALRVEMGDVPRARSGEWVAEPRVAVAFQRFPHGYLGLSFDGPNSESRRDGERFIRFYAYPRIGLVDPASPADRAGIRVGDTLIAMNGRDVLGDEFSLTRLLVPGDPLQVRLRRDGVVREFRITVGQAPEYVVQRWTPVPEAAPWARAPAAATAPSASPVPSAAPGPAPAPGVARVRSPQRPPQASAPAMANVWIHSDGVAGAKMETVTEGLGKALGVKRGVLVVRADAGTPASRAGLRDGDVIVRAAGTDVATVRQLRQLLERQASRTGVTLVVLRDRREREVTLPRQ